jgi:hypothetical protein
LIKVLALSHFKLTRPPRDRKRQHWDSPEHSLDKQDGSVLRWNQTSIGTTLIPTHAWVSSKGTAVGASETVELDVGASETVELDVGASETVELDVGASETVELAVDEASAVTEAEGSAVDSGRG